MPVHKNSFSLDYENIEKINKAIASCGYSSEGIINDYLHNFGGKKMSDSMTKYLPVSKKGKRHARTNKWYEQEDYNLAVSIANNTKGKRGKSFYYLYYVFTGQGTSRKKGKNDAMVKGYKKVENVLVSDLLNALEKNIEMEMNKK